MATATTTDDQVIEFEDYIDRQIARTSLHVKTLDLVSGSIVLGLVVLGSLLAIVVVDHWIVGLGFGARLVSLIAVVAASLFVLATRVLPPLIRAINPEYSAQVVERSFPALDNGLTSFLFFRRRRDMVRESIYAGMQRQAAQGLAEVPIDSAVDRSSIIKFGYALVAVTAVWCAYILFSPKDPLQTLMRIAAPWQDIARPSQVDILAISPGSVELFRGQTVDIKAEIRGLKQDAVPKIEYSTLDGQLLNQRLSMSPAAVDGHFAGILTTGEAGIQQDLEYRVVAGDAVSRTYEVHTSEAPHIVVERVSYDFPAYTGLPDEVVEGEGDVRAIEGTRVTVFGSGNQPIRRGHIELLSALEDPKDIATAGPSKQAPLIVNGQDARVRFSLRMGPDRQRSIYRGYCLHFVNESGVDSVDPIEHSIEVTRDLRPIVEIITPSKRTLEVPENGWEKIAIRAVDPDFQLTKVTLAARTRGRPLFRQELLTQPQQGQFTSTFNFIPKELGLKNGDVVEYLAAAEDNRHSPLQGKLDPNRTESSKQYFRIVEADPLVEQPPSPDDPEQPELNPDRQHDPADADQSKPRDRDQNDQQRGEENQKGEANDQPQQPGGEQRPEDEGNEEPQQGQEGGESGLQQSGKNEGDAKQQELDSGESGDAQSDSPDSQRGGGDQQTDSGEKDSSSDANRDGEPGGSSESTGDGSDESEPLPSTGERDSEVIDRIRKHLENKGELEPPSDQPNGQPNAQPDDERNSQTGEQPTAQDPDARSSDANQDATTESKEKVDRNGSKPAEQPNSDQGAADDPEKRDNSQDAPQKTQDNQQSSTSEDGKTEDGSKNDGSSSGESKDGQPSDQPGSPGDKGERHTDAANQADKPGPSPPDGKQPAENQDGKSSPQESGKSDPTSKENPNGENQRDVQPQSTGEQESGEKGAEQGGEQQGSSEESPGREGKSGDQKDGKQGSKQGSKAGETDENGSSKKADSGDSKSDSGDKSGDADSSKTSDGKSTSNQSSKSSQSSSADGKGKPGTQAEGADTSDTGDGAAGGEMTGDEANLEYKKKVTDLALEYLRDQQRKPDPDLLDKLGWEQDDVDNFLRRWDELKKKAQGEGAAATDAKRQLDDVLRNIKLDSRNGVRRAGANNDRQRNNRNTGRRTKVPTDLLDPFRAFQRSLQRSK